MTASEEIAGRYADARDGYDLVSYREVALPLFQVTVEMLVIEQKSLPPIEEYVLRSVEAGLGDLPSIAGVLGIDERIARRAAVELLNSDNLVLAGSGENGQHALHLTAKGAQTARDAKHVQAVEVELPVFVDGLTRRVLSTTGRGLHAFAASKIAQRGLVEIAPHPQRKPTLEQLPFEEIKRVVGHESTGRRGRREMIGITGLGKTRRFARDAVALAYRSQSDGELVVTFIVDGKPSDEHDAAFSRAQQRSARRLTPAEWAPAETVIRQELPAELVAQAAPSEETSRLRALRTDAAREADEISDAITGADPDELQQLREKLHDAEARERDLLQKLQEISVRQVPVFEHRDYLDRALNDATTRVLIISPWIRHEVVDNDLIARFRKLLDRGVELWIGYGINKTGEDRKGKKGEADKKPTAALRRLQSQHPEKFRLTLLGDTHAKVLICDSRFSVVTSFNWLSFKGDVHLHFRDERGMYVGIPEKVDEIFESYRRRIEHP